MKQIVTAETQNGWLAGIGDAKPDVEVTGPGAAVAIVRARQPRESILLLRRW